MFSSSSISKNTCRDNSVQPATLQGSVLFNLAERSLRTTLMTGKAVPSEAG